MILERLMYSKKFLVLLLVLLYLTKLITTLSYGLENLAIGTAISVGIMSYFLLYAHKHTSAKEIFVLTFFVGLAIVFGTMTGCAFRCAENPGLTMYSLTLTLSITLLLFTLSKLYRT